MDANIEWLKHRVKQYQTSKTDACEAIDDFDELDKLGQGFTSADALEQVDIGTSSFIPPCDVCFYAPVALIFKVSPLGVFILHLGLLIRVVVL
jgi:hypothetical protein